MVEEEDNHLLLAGGRRRRGIKEGRVGGWGAGGAWEERRGSKRLNWGF